MLTLASPHYRLCKGMMSVVPLPALLYKCTVLPLTQAVAAAPKKSAAGQRIIQLPLKSSYSCSTEQCSTWHPSLEVAGCLSGHYVLDTSRFWDVYHHSRSDMDIFLHSCTIRYFIIFSFLRYHPKSIQDIKILAAKVFQDHFRGNLLW